MKFLFKAFVLIVTYSTAQARDVVFFAYSKESKHHKFVIEEIKRNIPVELINFYPSKNPCEEEFDDVILYMCLDKDDELKVVQSNDDVLKRSFNVFQKKRR